MMLRSHARLALALSLLLVGSAARGLPEQRQPMSLDLSEVALDRVLQTFARLTESRLEKHPDVDGTISFRFADVSWEKALELICQSAGCEWRLEVASERVLRVRPAVDDDSSSSSRISLSLNRASAQEVLSTMAKIGGAAIRLDPEIRGQVSIHFSNVEADSALDALCESLDCVWHRDTSADPPTLVIKRRGTRPAASARQRPSERLSKRLSLDLRGAKIEELLRSLAKILQVPIQFEPEIAGEIDLNLQEATVSEVLDSICREHFLVWRLSRDSDDAWALEIGRERGDFGPLGYVR